MGRSKKSDSEPRLGPGDGLPLWREVLAGRDWLSLRLSSVYYGFGVPRGDGSPVVLVPGFLGSDRYLVELYHWLRRMDYHPYYSGIGRNVECPDLLSQRLMRTVNRASSETGQKVRLVGHSLGGTIARTVAALKPRRVAQVITLGSPIRFARVHPAVLLAATIVRGGIRRNDERPPDCYTEGCNCSFVTSAGQVPPRSVSRAAIYSKRDGVVDWRCCLDDEEHLNIEVGSTHVGLAFSPEVYRAVAYLLAGAWPF